MIRFRKRQLGLAVAAGLAVIGGAALAQAPVEAPAEAAEPGESRLDALLAQLAEPEQEDWPRIESEIKRLWSRSGSDAMDLLLRRGTEAIESQDLVAAVEHLTALTDHAPGFAEGWSARATAFYLMGEHSLALADLEQVLILNPRHFEALAGLGIVLEEVGEERLALEAHRAAAAIHPHRPEIMRSIERLERRIGGAEL